MNDAFVVSILQRIAQMRDDRQCVLRLKLVCLHGVSQGRAVNVFHQEVECVFDTSKLKNRYNVGMIQLRQRASFSSKPQCKFNVVPEFFGQNLQSNNPVETFLPGFVNSPHAARTNESVDLQCWEERCQSIYGWRLKRAGLPLPFAQSVIDCVGIVRKAVEEFLSGRRFSAPTPVVDIQNDQFRKQHVSLFLGDVSSKHGFNRGWLIRLPFTLKFGAQIVNSFQSCDR